MTSQAAGKRAEEPPPESARAPARALYESGIPPSGEAPRRDVSVSGFDERIQLALAESAGLEMKLRLLVRGLNQLAAAASNVEQSHGSLVSELSELCDLVPGRGAADSALQKRVADLEHALSRARSSAAQERSLLIREQEVFLERLLTEHEQEVGELKRLLSAASNGGDDSDAEVDEEPEIPVIIARNELPSAECLEVHWEELEETAAQARMPASGAVPAARSSGPPPLPDAIDGHGGAAKRMT